MDKKHEFFHQAYEEMSPDEKKEFNEKIGKQIFITEVADVEYQCYFKKIDVLEFWKKELNW